MEDSPLRGLWRELPAPPPSPLQGFLPPRMVQGRRILAWEDVVFALAAGDPPVVVMAGPAGCGKTSAWLGLAHTLRETESGLPCYLRIRPGADPEPDELWAEILRRAHPASLADLAATGAVRILVDAEGLNQVQATALARALDVPPGMAVWVAVRTLRPPLEWGMPVLGAGPLAAPWPSAAETAPPGRADGLRVWNWAPPTWGAISLLLRRRKQADLLAGLARGEANWALRDPFLLGLLGRFHRRHAPLPAQPGPLLDALASEIAGSRAGDRGRQILVADLLPALAAAMEADRAEEWPDHRFRQLAFEIARATRLPRRPEDLAATGVAAQVLFRRDGGVAFCHPALREAFAAREWATRVGRSGTAPLLAPAWRLSDGMTTRLVARLSRDERLAELAGVLVRQGRWEPLAQGLVESRLPAAGGLARNLRESCRDLLGGGQDPREALRNPRAGWFEEPLAALVALGGSGAYEAVRDGMASSLAAFAGGLEACGLAGATFVAPAWTDRETSILADSPDPVAAYLEMERGYLRAAARALRYLDGNRFVAEMAEGRLPVPVIRALLWDCLEADVPRILLGPAAQTGAALLDASEARAWPTWILQTLPDPWGVAFLGCLGALAGPAGDPVAYMGWPPRRSEGFISVIQGLWHQSLAAVDDTDRSRAEEALDRLLETFAATWDEAPEGTWNAIPGRPVGRLAHFFLSQLHRHIGGRESLRASRGLNAALLACEPDTLAWHLARLREVLRVDRAGCLTPRQARLLGVALRFVPVRDRRLAELFGRRVVGG